MAKKKATKNSNRFKISDTQTPEDLAQHLEALARGLRDGKFLVDDQAGFEAVPVENVEFEMEAQRRRRRTRVEISISFRVAKRESSKDASEAPSSDEKATIPDEMSF